MGMGYGYVEHSSTPDICFNYLGDLGESQDAGYSTGREISEKNKLSDKITVNGQIVDGKLNFFVISQTEEFGQKFIEELGKKFVDCVKPPE